MVFHLLKNNDLLMKNHCPLCSSKGRTFFEDSKNSFFLCPECYGIFRDPDQFLNLKTEKERYLHHRNDMEDKGYYEFIHPLIEQVKLLIPEGNTGLDFGCGHTPVLSNYLLQEGYQMFVFDALFFNDNSILAKQYDFIVSCEVIEHFFNPLSEFKILFESLKPAGKLICKTHLFHEGIDFDQWYYKNDPTHVFIYQEETMYWIKNEFQFKDVKINDRVITFLK